MFSFFKKNEVEKIVFSNLSYWDGGSVASAFVERNGIFVGVVYAEKSDDSRFNVAWTSTNFKNPNEKVTISYLNFLNN